MPDQNAPTLEIKDLKVSVAGRPILDGVTLTIKPGEVHALMGPNGSGKSTLSYALAGHPRYKIDGGTALLDGKNLLSMPAHERAKAGLFLAFQQPQEIQGLNLGRFLFSLAKARDQSLSPARFKQRLDKALETMGMDKRFLERQLNVGFSGGEKKRAEVLQLILSDPKIAILDETDSGLDVDSLKVVSTAVNSIKGAGFSALVITHYPHILAHLNPDIVHVLVNGRIAATGGPELADQIEKDGYKAYGGADAKDEVFKIV